MKEIKVGELTKEEVKELKELEKMKTKIEILIAQFTSANNAWWLKLRIEHTLSSGNNYVVGNTIYKQE